MALTLNLEGKVALVTGSTRGIGWACAQVLAEAGATTILNGVHHQDVLDTKVAELKGRGFKAAGALFDCSDAEAVKKAYQQLLQTQGRLDILVNNAGILEDNFLGMVNLDAISRTMNTNVIGMMLNMQYASRLMSRSGAGSIINMSSIIGRVGNAGQVVYGASKAAVIGATLSAAKELAPSHIRVNAIAPGFIDTDMAHQLPKEKFDERLDSIKMKRIGLPRDVAHAVLFLASDLSSYITGQVLGVDGGMLI